MDNLRKIWEYKWILRSLISTLYFNFRFLPFSQAIMLPIVLYKPHFLRLKGRIRIESDRIVPKMIVLGCNRVPFYPNNGLSFYIEGDIVFKGRCIIGNNSIISVGHGGYVEFGDNFSATSALKITCSKRISFSNNVTIGWDCIFMDSDFHRMTKLEGGYTSGIGEIIIGANNWFCCKNIVLKNTHTSDFCTIAANTVLNKDYSSFGNNVLLAADTKVVVKATGLFLDPKDENSYTFKSTNE